jgi:hypothetical protein
MDLIRLTDELRRHCAGYCRGHGAARTLALVPRPMLGPAVALGSLSRHIAPGSGRLDRGPGRRVVRICAEAGSLLGSPYRRRRLRTCANGFGQFRFDLVAGHWPVARQDAAGSGVCLQRHAAPSYRRQLPLAPGEPAQDARQQLPVRRPEIYYHSGAAPVYAPNSGARPWADATGAAADGWEADGAMVRSASTLHAHDDDAEAVLEHTSGLP